jgi:hypothetical protein
MKMTRRKLAAAFLAPAAAPAQAPKAATPEEELAAARRRLQTAIDAVRKFQIAPAVEPDFTFKA